VLSPTEPNHSTKKWLSLIEKSKEFFTDYTVEHEKFQDKLYELCFDIAKASDSENTEEIIKDIQTRNHRAPLGDKAWSIDSNYSQMAKKLKELLDEEKQIKKLERQAHTRNIIARAVTTLVIGFSIMTVYWIAHELKIPMPMLKLPVN